MPTNLSEIEKAISRAAALHALLLGARADADKVANEVQANIAGLKSEYEAAVQEQAARVEVSQKAVVGAEETLKSYQGQVHKDTGALIDLLPVVAKGSTRL